MRRLWVAVLCVAAVLVLALIGGRALRVPAQARMLERLVGVGGTDPETRPDMAAVHAACAAGDTFPLWSCAELGRAAASAPEHAFRAAVAPLCGHARYRDIINTNIPCAFAANYARVYSASRWADEAFVTYIHGARGSRYMKMTEALVASLHAMSGRPVVLFCVDAVCDSLGAAEFPRLVVINVRRTAVTRDLTLDYYKWLGAVLARVHTGIALDADMMALPAIDSMFERVRLHTTAAYPYPILPVHWMSRDPAGGDYPEYVFTDALPYARSMRWGHAHPTWTHHALPFLGEMVLRMVNGSFDAAYSDEDVANMMLWEKRLTRQWCKWDMDTVDLPTFLDQSPTAFVGDSMADSKWYRDGVPVVFTAVHNMKNATHTREVLADIVRAVAAGRTFKTFVWNGTWFATAQELEAAGPPCVV